MGTFEVTTARRQLGFTPSTSAYANIDVRTGGGTMGSAGQGILKGVSQFMAAREKQKEKMNAERAKQQKILEAIREKKQQMVDANNAVIIQKDIDLAEQEFLQYKINNPQETWEAFRINQVKDLSEKPAKLPFSPDALVEQQLKVSSYGEVAVAKALTDSMYQLRTDTIDAQYNGLVDAFRSGEPQRIVEFSRLYVENGANMGKDKAEVLSDIKRAEYEGGKQRADDLMNGVYAAVEAASDPNTGTGNFGLARELAKNPAIPEDRQVSLRTTIGSAESSFGTRIKERQREAIDNVIASAAIERDNARNLSRDERDKKGYEIIAGLSKSLTGTMLESQIEKTRKWVKGEDETKHPISVATMDAMATDIWRGAKTKKQFNDEMARRRRLPESNPDSLSDSESASVMKSADTELRTSQAQALSIADEMAGRALVDYKSDPEWFAALSSATGVEKETLSDKRKLQFEILNQYNNEMRGFIADKPEVSGKEFDQVRDTKRYEYINRRAELEKNIKINIETTNPETGKPMRKPNETVAEFLNRTGQE